MGKQVVAKITDTQALQNFAMAAKAINWEMNDEDCLTWMKVAVAGISDCLNTLKNKDVPVVVLVQDLKGNRIVFACVQFIKADDDDEAATGNWTYFWSFDMNDIPEGATIYTAEQESIERMIATRGNQMVNMVMTNLAFVPQLLVYMFNILRDTLDQTYVEEGDSYTIVTEGYFEASVEVNNGQKSFSFVPAGEMKAIIKNDAALEK